MQKLQLTIPEPCHQNWQQMTPTEQGRFCNACAKEVIDFSMMTDTEVLNYFTTITHEKVCGRALPSQLDRNITKPKELKKRLFWYWNYLVMFFMFFGKGNGAKAQGGIKPVTELSTVKANEVRGDITVVNVVKEGSRVVTGKITDIDGNPVSFASIKIKGTSTEMNADANGSYSLKVKQNDTLFITGVSFKSADVPVGTASIINTVLENAPTVLNEWGITKVHRHARFIRKVIAVNTDSLYVIDGTISTKTKADNLSPDDISDITRLAKNESVALFGSDALSGAVVITTRKAKEIKMKEVIVTSEYGIKGAMSMAGGISYTNTYESSLLGDTIATVKTLLTDSIKIFPNPVQRNTVFSVALKLKQGGNHSIQVTDAAGKILLLQNFKAITKEYTEKVVIDSRWAGGFYYIRVFDAQNKLLSKSSFIVQ